MLNRSTILNNPIIDPAGLPKHRSFRWAVLSALLVLSIAAAITGLYLVVTQIPAEVPGSAPAAVSLTQEGRAVSPPVRLRIPALKIDAPVVKLGLNANRSLQVPKGDWEVGWYAGSPSPGAVGPAVMVGHLDSVRGPAIFQNLYKLKPGDAIEVVHEDGSVASFEVSSSEKYAQSQFPTDKVYGRVDYAGLRLITCAGTYSRLKGRYSDNLVVYAGLKQ